MPTGTDGCIRVDSRTSEAVNSVQELLDCHLENAEQALWFVLRPCSSSLFFYFASFCFLVDPFRHGSLLPCFMNYAIST